MLGTRQNHIACMPYTNVICIELQLYSRQCEENVNGVLGWPTWLNVDLWVGRLMSASSASKAALFSIQHGAFWIYCYLQSNGH